MGQVDGKVVIVTGAARGQGAAEARWLATEGAHVLLTDILDDEGEEVAREVAQRGDDAMYQHLDVASEVGWAQTVAAATNRWGRVDALVNNAGVSHRVGIEDIELDDWQRVLDVNLTGPLLGIRAVTPVLRAAGGGTIVNVSSIAGLTAYPASAYTASKWALRGLTKTAALELGRDAIRVNSIHPGLIDTPMVADAPGEFRDAFSSTTPLRRPGEADDVAPLVGFLCSDGASFISGAEVAIDGGFTAAGHMRSLLTLMEQSTGEPAHLRVELGVGS